MALDRHPIFSLDPATYQPHRLHQGDRDWLESNCYIDVYIEVLNALGLDVMGCLAFTLSSGFEDDQWTFFKPPLSELHRLYGLNVQELTLWRPLIDHVVEQVAAGKIVTPEVDAYYLPDVAATDYKTAHVKTTVSIPRIDRDAKRLCYFHNTGYHVLEGEDFDGVFRLGIDEHADYLPPYCELMKLDELVVRPTAELADVSLQIARDHLRRRPQQNPMHVYRERLARDIDWLVTRDLTTYHAYVFATLRQCGAGFEFAALYLRWLGEHAGLELSEASDRLASISSTAKMMILKLARIARSKKVKDLSEHVDQMASDWDQAMTQLDQRLRP